MTQETRKDKRAPVSLRVRFKSATIDEFIEQYSTDISKGGIFIKSRQPMAVGTLLKFEFQLKDNSPLIQGVGRVVWKREPDPAKPDLAPGMGIKFIKMGPESRAVVDRIVSGREEGDEFEEGGEDSTRIANVSQVMAESMKEPSAPHAMKPPPAAAPPPKVTAPPPARPPAPTAPARAPLAPTAPRPTAPAPSAPRPVAPRPAPAPKPEPVDPLDERTETAVGVPGKQIPASSRGEAAIAAALRGVSRTSEPPAAEAPKPAAASPRAAPAPSPRPAPVPAPAPTARVVPTTAQPKRTGAMAFVWVVLVAALGGAGYWWFFLRGGGGGPAEAGDADAENPIAAMADAGHVADAGRAKVAGVDAGHAAPAAEASLTVRSRPDGATVFLDDTERGVTPLETKVAAGKALRVRVQLAGYAAFSQEVTPAADAPTAVDAGALRELHRILSVTSEPSGADVLVAGRRRGRTPTRIEIRRLSDAVEVKVTRRGFQEFSTTIDPETGWREVDGEYVRELAATLTEAGGGRGPRHGPQTGPGTAAPATAAPATAAPATAAPPPTTAAPHTAAPRTSAPATNAPPATSAPRTAAPIPDNPFG